MREAHCIASRTSSGGVSKTAPLAHGGSERQGAVRCGAVRCSEVWINFQTLESCGDAVRCGSALDDRTRRWGWQSSWAVGLVGNHTGVLARVGELACPTPHRIPDGE